MKFLKKQKLGFIAYAVVAVMSVVSLFIYISNVTAAYYEDMNIQVVVMMAGVLILTAAVMILPQFSDGSTVKVLVDIFRIGMAILIIMSGAVFIGMRVESFGYIFGSNLEMGNTAAFTAGNQAIVGIVLFVVTWVLSLGASFMEVGRKSADPQDT